jgi:hypothetical protein
MLSDPYRIKPVFHFCNAVFPIEPFFAVVFGYGGKHPVFSQRAEHLKIAGSHITGDNRNAFQLFPVPCF